MKLPLVFSVLTLVSCTTLSPTSGPTMAITTCAQPSKDGWPVHPGHFYDQEIHLVPSFSKAPKNYNATNFMTGYSVVYVKPDSNYAKMGLNFGDELISIDNQTLNDVSNPQGSAPTILGKVKNHEFKVLQVRRCLEIK